MLNFNLFVSSLKKIFTLKGRASKKEFWTFALYNMFMSLIVNLIIIFCFFLLLAYFFPGTSIKLDNKELAEVKAVGVLILLLFIINLPIYIASISLYIRRFHDFNKSGWHFLLLFLINIIPNWGWILFLLCLIWIGITPGDKTANDYGEPNLD